MGYGKITAKQQEILDYIKDEILKIKNKKKKLQKKRQKVKINKEGLNEY